VIASLLLRHVVLQPGEAVFMPAGGLHAYLHGTGIELLANSDNVIRAGLTPKHIDVPELLKLTVPGVAVPVLEPRPLGGGVSVYDSPAPEFRLYRAELGGGEIALPGPGGARIAFCTEGAATLRAGGAAAGPEELTVGRGESCFIAAADGAVTASGPAMVFVAASGLAPVPRG
jgi:mannose-6-phosphate isomerase